MRTYSTLPRLPDAGLLARYLDTLGVIVPIARTNMVLNPSLETNTTGYTAVGASIARTTDQQYHGAYSLGITPTSATVDGAYYGTVSLISGTTYAVSCKVRGAAGRPYKFSLATTGGADLATYRFTATGRWQWIYLLYTETSTTTRRVYLLKDSDANTSVFYWDGLQVEACEAGNFWPTTYIDGDQQGLVANQYPPAYLWTGTPHGSTSIRSGQTRAGGRIVRFRDLGFLLTTIIGLGMAPPRHEALTFAQLDGGQYQNTLKPPRSFSLVGRVAATTPNEADAALVQIGALLDRDLIAQRQPLTLTMQAQECGVDCGDRVFVQALYSGGLEGQVSELPTAQAPITFTQYLPYVTGGDQGAALTTSQTVAPANAIVARAPDGQWSTVGQGVLGGALQVFAIVRGLNGLIYVGGNFTDAGGTGADYLASYNPATNTWSALGSTTAINAQIRALAVGPDGRIYAGGNFTNAGGIAAADGIAVWDPVAGTWAALSTGTAGQILALAFSPSGTLYAGGSFTSIGASTADNVAQWNGTAWSNLTSDTAINAAVESLAWGNGRLYVGGGFTNAGGVAAADYIATWTSSAGWGALSTGMNSDVLALAVGTNGLVYAGGAFTTAGGLSIPYLAAWNGQQWAALGSGVNNTVWSLAVAPDGTVYAGGIFSTAGGLTLSDGFARWSGSTWLPPDIALVGTATIYALALTPDGTLYVGYDTNPVSTATGITAITNNGGESFPTLILYGPSVGAGAPIYQLVNTTTGGAVYFRNLTLNIGEQMTLTLDPDNITFVSTFQGNILSSIAPGSQLANMQLQPGTNTISLFAPGATAVLRWPQTYNSLNKALYQAVAP